MNNKSPLQQLVQKLTWKQCENILENHGFAVYESESLGKLRQAVKINIKDGTISQQYVESILEASNNNGN
jgi:carbamoylphosphate synthase small subunit